MEIRDKFLVVAQIILAATVLTGCSSEPEQATSFTKDKGGVLLTFVDKDTWKISHTFVITNETEDEFHLSLYRTSCGCASLKFDKDNVLPGETFEVDFILNARYASERRVEKALLTTGSKQAPILAFELKAFTHPRALIDNGKRETECRFNPSETAPSFPFIVDVITQNESAIPRSFHVACDDSRFEFIVSEPTVSSINDQFKKLTYPISALFKRTGIGNQNREISTVPFNLVVGESDKVACSVLLSQNEIIKTIPNSAFFSASNQKNSIRLTSKIDFAVEEILVNESLFSVKKIEPKEYLVSLVGDPNDSLCEQLVFKTNSDLQPFVIVELHLLRIE
jgi:hypothetical protein